MSRIEEWLERRGEPPAAFLCEIAADRFWRGRRRFVATHVDLDEAVVAGLIPVAPELAHGLTLVLSRLPERERYDFAEAFLELRADAGVDWPETPEGRLRAAAAVALLVLELTRDEGLRSARIVDLLTGAQQGDDLTLTPGPAVDALRKVIARVRFDVDLQDEDLPRSAASIAVVEVLDPSSDAIDLKEVLARAAWAAVESWERPRVLSFLLEAARLLDDAAP